MEQIEVLIASENTVEEVNEFQSKPSILRSTSIQRALRMSIFTIQEEDDIEDE